MDARITLALIAVLRKVLAADKSPVAFLRNPEGIAPERFKALSGFDDSAEGNSALFSLAWLVNGRIDLPYVQNSMSVPLWSLVDDILNKNGRRGARDRLEGDEAAYREARAVLYVEDGTADARPSEAHLKHQQMRDEWFCRRQEMASKRLELDLLLPGDPRRPALELLIDKLRSELDVFERRWEEGGFRARIESAVQTVDAIAARAPGKQWSRWRDMLAHFLGPGDGLGGDTDILSRGRFAATAIMPSGIERSPESWTSMSIGGAAVERLVAALPAELSTPLNPVGDSLNLESLEFEWTTAGIVRPWLDRALFASRSWKFDDAARIVSDGAAEPDGECPYVAAGLVLVRNAKAAFKPGPPPPPLPTPSPPPPRVRPGAVVRDHRINRGMVSRLPFTTTGRPPPPLPDAGARRFVVQPFHAAPRPASGPIETAPQPAFVLLQTLAFAREAVPTETAPTAAGPVAEAPEAAGPIMIFGLICNAVPRCPNPDPEFFR